jgi:hypothetical protein
VQPSQVLARAWDLSLSVTITTCSRTEWPRIRAKGFDKPRPLFDNVSEALLIDDHEHRAVRVVQLADGVGAIASPWGTGYALKRNDYAAATAC